MHYLVLNDWILLVVAGLLETAWAVGLKYSEGLTKLVPSLWTGVCLAASMFFLAVSLRTIPISAAYPIWVGIGVLGTSVLGAYLFDEALTPLRIALLMLLLLAILGLKLTASPGA